jgi:hypothetical protein
MVMERYGMKGSLDRRNQPRGCSTSSNADVISYVLKNGPGSVTKWRWLTFYLGSRSESNMRATFTGETRRIQVRGVTKLRPEAG